MNQNQYKYLTWNAYPLKEVMSALQKTIRRGMTEDAFFWAMEMEPHFHQKLWERLLIIASEDIGQANPQMAQLGQSLYQTYMFLRKRGAGGRKLCVAQFIQAMCASPKSRECDEMVHHYYIHYAYPKENAKLKEVPDFALDKHTDRGKRMGRDITHFFSVASHCENDVGKHEYTQEIIDFYTSTGGRKPIGSVDDYMKEQQGRVARGEHKGKAQASMFDQGAVENPFEGDSDIF